MEVTGILEIKKVDKKSEEVSIKTRGGPHSKNDKTGRMLLYLRRKIQWKGKFTIGMSASRQSSNAFT